MSGHNPKAIPPIFTRRFSTTLSSLPRFFDLIVSLLAIFGLVYLNATSDGLTATIKQLWRPKIQDKRD